MWFDDTLLDARPMLKALVSLPDGILQGCTGRLLHVSRRFEALVGHDRQFSTTTDEPGAP